ncbi:MAG: Hsp70 family protein [Cyanobacteria bacterium J06641_5]
MTIAIDFGTSNTVVAQATTAGETVLALPGLSQTVASSPPLIPSLLYVEDASADRVLVGQQVRDRGTQATNDGRFFRTFKRGIGAEMQGFLPDLDGTSISFEQVGEWFLQTVLAAAQTEAGAPIESLVLTVPVDSFEPYRQWLATACSKTLAVQRLRLLDEPTAAALGYGVVGKSIMLVVDFGGGTLDFSLVQLDLAPAKRQQLGFILKWDDKVFGETSGQKPRLAKVLAKTGTNLGGSDIDNWLADRFARDRSQAVTPQLVTLAEQLKIQLTSQETGEVTWTDPETGGTDTLTLQREAFEEILKNRGLFTQLDDLMQRTLQEGRRRGIETQAIDAVLLVGGTAQIPAVQTWATAYFPAEKIRCDKPFTAVAIGALQVGDSLELEDFLYHSYGIRYWNRRDNCHSWHPIIKAGQPYPTRQPVEIVLGASMAGQPSIELVIGELGEATAGRTEVVFEGDRLVTRQVGGSEAAVKPLNDTDSAKTIAVLEPPGTPGRDRIKVCFRVDDRCQLRITVEDLLTQRPLLEDRVVVELS